MRKPCAATKLTAHRRGSLIVEVLVAAALFSTAVFALGRLAQQTASLSVHADEQLSVQLTGENILAQLKAADFDDIEATARRLETEFADSTDRNVQIKTSSVQIATNDAVHWVVRISAASASETSGDSLLDQPLILHDWRINDSAGESSDDGEDSDE